MRKIDVLLKMIKMGCGGNVISSRLKTVETTR